MFEPAAILAEHILIRFAPSIIMESVSCAEKTRTHPITSIQTLGLCVSHRLLSQIYKSFRPYNPDHVEFIIEQS